MKLTDTLYYFLPVMMGAAGLAASIAFGSVDTEPVAIPKPVIARSAESVVYFPARYTLNAPSETSEHIQAF